MSNLFRSDAVKYQLRRLDGDVIIAVPLSNRLLSFFVVLIVLGGSAFAASSSYARKETVSGWVVPEGGLIRVSARQGGLVQSLPAREGVEVAAGAPLAVLRLSFDSTSGDTGKAIDRDLTDEEAANEAQARASHAKLAEQRTQLIASRASLAKELEEIERRTALLEQRQQLAEEQVARTSTLLSKGFVTAANVDSLRSAALSVAQDASETRASAVDYQRQIGDIDHQLAALPADIAALNAQAAQSRATLAQRRIVADTQSIYIASAPISGRVIAIPVEVGQAVPVGAAVAVITPEGSHLTAELYVPSRAAGFIRKGQEVSLMYQAFPYQTFGTGKGTVMSVSRTVLAPNEIAIPGLTVQEPVFRVRVALERAEVSAYGHAIPLQPGMLLTADVVIDRRNLIQWLLDPLYAVGRRT